MKWMGLVFVMLLAMAGIGWADITFGSATVTPSTLKPGVGGTASFLVTNTGTSTVNGLSFDISGYGFDLPQKTVFIGDIGAGGSTQVTVPFRIKSDVPAGVYTLQASTLLSVTSGSSTNLVSRTFTVPVSVSNPATFEVASSGDKTQISPGGDVRMHLRITNKGGKATNVRLAANSTHFIIKDASQVAIGDVGAGEMKELDVSFTASSSLAGGTYSIPIKLTYEDAIGVTNIEPADVGPIRVVKIPTDFALTATTDKEIYPGDKFVLYLDIKNNGVEYVYSPIIKVMGDAKSGLYFVSLDSAERGLSDFAPGESKRLEANVGVNGNAPPGYYALNATITYLNTQGELVTVGKLFGLEVHGKYDVSIIAEPSPKPVTTSKVYSLSVQVSNTGTGDLKAVSAELFSSKEVEVIGTPYGFIGELKDGDYSSVQFDVYVKPGLAPGRYPLTVNVTFFDAYNQEHVVTKRAYVDLVSPEIAALASGTAGGPSALTMIIGLAVLAAVIWYANKKGWLEGVKAKLHVGHRK